MSFISKNKRQYNLMAGATYGYCDAFSKRARRNFAQHLDHMKIAGQSLPFPRLAAQRQVLYPKPEVILNELKCPNEAAVIGDDADDYVVDDEQEEQDELHESVPIIISDNEEEEDPFEEEEEEESSYSDDDDGDGDDDEQEGDDKEDEEEDDDIDDYDGDEDVNNEAEEYDSNKEDHEEEEEEEEQEDMDYSAGDSGSCTDDVDFPFDNELEYVFMEQVLLLQRAISLRDDLRGPMKAAIRAVFTRMVTRRDIDQLSSRTKAAYKKWATWQIEQQQHRLDRKLRQMFSKDFHELSPSERQQFMLRQHTFMEFFFAQHSDMICALPPSTLAGKTPKYHTFKMQPADLVPPSMALAWFRKNLARDMEHLDEQDQRRMKAALVHLK